MANLFSPQELIPSYWHNVYANSEEDLIFLGSKNLRELRNSWRSDEKEVVKRIKHSQKLVDLLKNGAEELRALAAGYDHPDYCVQHANGNDEPIGVDAEQRKPGTTTFNLCGWCHYSEEVWQHYGYYVNPVCSLIPHEYGNGQPYGGSKKYDFSHPCELIARLDEEDFLDACAAYIASKHQELLQEKAVIGEKINYLTKLIPQAEPKPYLVCARPNNMFSGGERVMLYLGDKLYIYPEYRQRWISGIIATAKTPGVPPLMSNFQTPGITLVWGDHSTHTAQVCDDCRGYNVGKGRPELLLESEYKYLKKHPDFAKIWLRHVKSDVDRKFRIF